MVNTRFVAVLTQTPLPVANFVFRSDCWNGGYELPAGALIQGSFRCVPGVTRREATARGLGVGWGGVGGARRAQGACGQPKDGRLGRQPASRHMLF